MQTRSCFRNKKCVKQSLCVCVFWHTLCNAVVWFAEGDSAAAAFVSFPFLFKEKTFIIIYHYHGVRLLTPMLMIWLRFYFSFFFWEISCSCNRCHQSNLLTTVTSSSCHFSGHFICISCYYFGFFLFIVVLLSRSLFCWIFRRNFLFTFH